MIRKSTLDHPKEIILFILLSYFSLVMSGSEVCVLLENNFVVNSDDDEMS